MNRYFLGIYASFIEQFIDFKRQMGFKYDTEEIIYSIFDRFTIERGETIVGITKDLADAWKGLKPNESDSYRFHRMLCLNQLASFLSRIGIRSYISQLPRIKSTFTPYIFSTHELSAIFKACDEVSTKKSPELHYHYPPGANQASIWNRSTDKRSFVPAK